MENEQFALDLQKIIDADQANAVEGSEDYMLINNITNSLSNLPLLFQVLPNYQGNIRHLMIIFVLIRDILKKRGCLLSLQNLEDLVNFFPIIENLSHEIALSNEVSPICCDVIAYIYRFIFEQMIDDHPSFDPAFQLIATSSESKIILGLKIMSSIVDIMKTPMKHISIKQRSIEIAKNFEKSQLPSYFKVAVENSFKLSPLITPVALDLIITIFQFHNTKKSTIQSKEDDSFEFEFDVPNEIFEIYQKFDMTNNLFNIYYEMDLNKSIDCITYLACISKNSWKANEISPISFVNSIEEHLTQIFGNSEHSEKVIFSISNLISKLGKLIFISQNEDDTEISPTFIPLIQQISIFLFESYSLYPNSCNKLLKFWQILFKNNGFIQKYISVLSPIFTSIYQNYLNGLLNSISTDLDQIDNFEIFIKDTTPLLEICQLSLDESGQFIGQIVNSYLSELEQRNIATFFRLCVSILILTSFLNGPVDNIIRENNETISFFSTIIQLVFEIILKTNENQESLIQLYDENSFCLELALIQFSVVFLKKFFTSPFQYGDDILQVIKIEKQQAFDLIISRFLNDLTVFIRLPDSIIEILNFLNTQLIKNHSKLSSFFSMNEIYNELISHRRFLGIEAIEEFEKASKIAIELNRFYSFSLKYDQLGEFLAFFDQKFSQNLLDGFQNPAEVLVLYRQIEGVLKGSESAYQYTFVWRWLLLNHADHISQCITSQASEFSVIKSICHVLINMAKGTNLNLPASSSEGLQMVKHMHEFVNMINDSVENNDSITYYMVKILAFSISTNYANFGIMKLYGDDTIDKIVGMFFIILKNWNFDTYSKYKNFLSIISNAFDSILQFLPNLIQNDENFPVVLNFYLKAMNEIRSYHTQYKVKNGEIYSSFAKLLKFFVKNKTFQIWPSFRPHLIVLLNTLFDTFSNVVNLFYDSLFLIAKYDQENLTHVFQMICESFDEAFREDIDQLLQSLFQAITENSHPNKRVFAQFEMFSNSIKKFSIQLEDIPEFSQFFNES